MIKKENHTLGLSSNQGTSFLFGHDEQIKFLLARIKTGQIPNAWLFHGPIGVGKASLALNIAKMLSNIDISKKDIVSCVSEKDVRNPKTTININNIFYCKRRWDNKKKIFQKYISIEDIRDLNRRFSLSSTDNSHKICIVDTTEDLNLPASNSLLKILEEPPKNTLFILVSNNHQAILPTILSRCQKIGFQGLHEKDLRNICSGFLKETQFDKIKDAGVVNACEGSVRKLQNFLDNNYLKMFNAIKDLLLDLPTLNKRKAITLLAKNKDYLASNDPDKSVIGIILRLLSSLAKKEISPKNKAITLNSDTSLIAAHLYGQISLLRHQSIEYNIDTKKVVFLALNTIDLAFAKSKKE